MGDKDTHDYENSPNGSEWLLGFEISGRCKYSSLENVEISKNYRYLIVDDDSDMLRGQNFVQTDFQTGLTDEDVNEMKAFLEMPR